MTGVKDSIHNFIPSRLSIVLIHFRRNVFMTAVMPGGSGGRVAVGVLVGGDGARLFLVLLSRADLIRKSDGE